MVNEFFGPFLQFTAIRRGLRAVEGKKRRAAGVVGDRELSAHDAITCSNKGTKVCSALIRLVSQGNGLLNKRLQPSTTILLWIRQRDDRTRDSATTEEHQQGSPSAAACLRSRTFPAHLVAQPPHHRAKNKNGPQREPEAMNDAVSQRGGDSDYQETAARAHC